MAIFLSKINTAPYDEITIENPRSDITTIEEVKTYNTSDFIDTIYLILIDEKKEEIRLKVENEPIRGAGLSINNKVDGNGNLIWEKQIILSNLDTLDGINNTLVIPIKIKWSTLNNIYFNNSFNYNAIINIYDTLVVNN